jgi:hypothetical protein
MFVKEDYSSDVFFNGKEYQNVKEFIASQMTLMRSCGSREEYHSYNLDGTKKSTTPPQPIIHHEVYKSQAEKWKRESAESSVLIASSLKRVKRLIKEEEDSIAKLLGGYKSQVLSNNADVTKW